MAGTRRHRAACGQWRAGVRSAAARRARRAALVGLEFSVTDLAAVTGRAASSMIAPIAEAVAAGTLAERPGGGLAFRHELLRTALYDSGAPELRRQEHRQAAEALDRAGAPPERVTEHLLAVQVHLSHALCKLTGVPRMVSTRFGLFGV